MRYILIKNGSIVTPNSDISQKDILIGNQRILQIEKSIAPPHYQTQIIDAQNSYVLPGLINYLCPFIKKKDEKSLCAMYKSIAHGATMLIDTIRKKDSTLDTADINRLVEEFKFLTPSYGFHLSASAIQHLNFKDIQELFILQGCSSIVIRWKHVEKIIDKKLQIVFEAAAQNGLPIIITTKRVKESLLISKGPFFQSYLSKLRVIKDLARRAHITMIFTDIASHEEVEAISPSKYNDHIYLSLTYENNEIPSPLSKTDVLNMAKYDFAFLQPPSVSEEKSLSSIYQENSNNNSFLSQLLEDELNFNHKLKEVTMMYATRPAQILGLYPEKGVLMAGADADIILWQPNQKQLTTHSILRKDIKGMLINGQLITHSELKLPVGSGQFKYRNGAMSL